MPAKQGISHVLQVLSAINGYSEITDNVRLCPTFRGARAGQSATDMFEEIPILDFAAHVKQRDAFRC